MLQKIPARWQTVLFLFLLAFSSFSAQKQKPVLYLIGDSTVRNGDGTGKGGQWGWGSFLAQHFDTARIEIQNHAMGGRSSRTFITEGRWEKVLSSLKKGDYVMMQFGHNDASPLDDTARARGTINGVGTESKEIYNPITKKQEVVYTYGWYMRKYVRESKEKGAFPIVCSLVPRNNWKDGKVTRSANSYQSWAEQVAREEGAYFIDLNSMIADKYESLGATAVAKFFPADHTHTDKAGARLNAAIVTKGIRKVKPAKLQKFLLKKRQQPRTREA